MTTDPFSSAHRANARAAERKAAKETSERQQAEAKARLEARLRPKFNDIPGYKFKDVFKWVL